MFRDLRLIIINHIGAIVASIVILIALYFIYVQVVDKTGESSNSISELSNVIDTNTSRVYDNTILSASQVLTTIKNYYNNSNIMILLLNNGKDYNNTGYRFWVTGKGGKYGQNTNYESIIISSNYNDVTNLMIQEKSINSKYSKKSLDSYSNSNEKNYINLSSKYKSVLLKCNGYIVGMAFLAI